MTPETEKLVASVISRVADGYPVPQDDIAGLIQAVRDADMAQAALRAERDRFCVDWGNQCRHSGNLQHKLDAAEADNSRLAAELAEARAQVARLREALPSDDDLARMICCAMAGDKNVTPVPDSLMPTSWLVERDRFARIAKKLAEGIRTALAALPAPPGGEKGGK